MPKKIHRSIPETHSKSDKANLLAHFLSEEGDTQASIIIYELLVEIGEVSAMTSLADVLSSPTKFMDIPRAKELYMKACVAGDFCGCYNLGILYDQLGDTVSAQKYFELARSRGAPD
jgi:hypothetical protein